MDDLRAALGQRITDTYVAARSGDYQLLLGAGSSFGAMNGLGCKVPGAEDLIKILATEYPEALIEDGNSLQRAYQRAVQEVGSESVWRFLKKVFGQVDHDEWFTHLTEYPWSRVWTLNIDDSFERAFPRGLRGRIMDIRSVDWDEEYSESDALQVVHLHGSILGGTPSSLVFSFSEYASLAARRPVWDSMLRGSVGARPFVILGARGLDEPDIEATLLGNRPQASAPSIVVNPFITAGQRREFEGLGYIVFAGTAEEFVNQWAEIADFSSAQLGSLYATTAVSIPEFTELSLDQAPIPARNHDLIGGSEPLWNDARVGTVVSFEWMDDVSEFASAWLTDKSRSSELHVVFGDRLVGLSSGILGVARELRRKGAVVLSFDRRARFDRKRLVDFCRNRGPVVLLSDAAHEFTMYFDELMNDLQQDPNCKVLLLFAEKRFHELQVDNHFRSGRAPRTTTVVSRRRTKRDASRIESLLARRGRLGKLEQLPVNRRRSHFVNRDIFSAMAEVERGRGFKRRLSRELSALTLDWHRDLLLMLAIAAHGGHQVSIEEAAFGVRVSVDQLISDVRDNTNLNAVVELAEGLIFARQRSSTLEGLFTAEEANSRLKALATVTRALSGLATTSSLRERNRPASLVGGLMQARTLREVFPTADINGYYESLIDAFGDWNARYWEQRAINARLDGNWGPAESWASRAVSIKDDPYTRTTLGTILLNKSLITLEYGDPTWTELYHRGKAELEVALEQDHGNRVAAISFLQSSLKLMRACLRYLPNGQHSDEFSMIAADWRSRYASVQLVGSVDDSAKRIANDLVKEYESYVDGSFEGQPPARPRREKARSYRAKRKEPLVGNAEPTPSQSRPASGRKRKNPGADHEARQPFKSRGATPRKESRLRQPVEKFATASEGSVAAAQEPQSVPRAVPKPPAGGGPRPVGREATGEKGAVAGGGGPGRVSGGEGEESPPPRGAARGRRRRNSQGRRESQNMRKSES